jgi:hypothetical protein
LGRRYHIAAQISCSDHTVTFSVKDLEEPSATVQTVVVPHDIRSKLSAGSAQLVIGGLNKRAPTHQWDGEIQALRLASGAIPVNELAADPEKWTSGLVVWRSSDLLSSQFTWTGSDRKISASENPFRQAMNDICQVLLNSNEFFYLH